MSPKDRPQAMDRIGEPPWAMTPEKIAEAVALLVAAGTPQQVIAFGSAATGDLTSANDLDLLVIQPQVPDRLREMVRLRRALRGLLMPIDLIVTSRERFDDRAQVPGTVEFAARTQGRVLYDAG
jgi:predicted nucleotidyltransferase